MLSRHMLRSWTHNLPALALYRPPSVLQWLSRFNPARHWKLLLVPAILCLVEVLLHVRSFAIARPDTNLDPPFHTGCQEPVLNSSARANAVLVMLARNSDVDDAIASVRSVQEQFNRNFAYPWVFLNDEPWSHEFVTRVSRAVEHDDAGATATFEVIPDGMWGYPDWIDQDRARGSMEKMQKKKVPYAGRESYHHMCRFNSGFFYDHYALRDYKWYWRVEPGVSFTCAITYDPFIEMERNNKRYGYTIALWEVGKAVPSLFDKLSRYKHRHAIETTALWTAMTDPSWLPWPLRSILSWLPNRSPSGDLWNTCHFWSNFEIADMDFFRSRAYRDIFRYLDEEGGFYYERWGDAPVHSLAAAMLLRPEQVHHFSDFGYVHRPFQYCPYAPTAAALLRGELVPDMAGRIGKNDVPERSLGCNCKCDTKATPIKPTCFNRLRRTVM
ncbi:hypothetical protein S40288_07001 [Stachybotrys chartarum IBT 40288]|nr:hypothetical protein S40288_07001 [Stachybotrys chartarum IBT 40288]